MTKALVPWSMAVVSHRASWTKESFADKHVGPTQQGELD